MIQPEIAGISLLNKNIDANLSYVHVCPFQLFEMLTFTLQELTESKILHHCGIEQMSTFGHSTKHMVERD